METRHVLLMAAILAGLSAMQANAADGLYLGAGVGQSAVKDATAGGNFDTTATGYKGFAGYRFNKIPIVDLAAEVGYVDFGKPSQDIAGQRIDFKLHGGYLAGLLIFPLGPFDIYGKGGALSWKSQSNVGATNSSRSGTDAFYGVGAAFYFWKIGVRAEYERYQIKEVDRVNMLSVSALIQF
jgi:hypothetical protein